jgi:hypothetical protein
MGFLGRSFWGRFANPYAPIADASAVTGRVLERAFGAEAPGRLGRRGRPRSACLKERGRVKFVWPFGLDVSSCRNRPPVGGRAPVTASGSGWSARSEARTNDLDAGVERRRRGQAVDAVVDGRGVRTVVPRGGVLRVGRLGCRGMSSPTLERGHGGFRLRPGGLNQLAVIATAGWETCRSSSSHPAAIRAFMPPRTRADSGSRHPASRSRRA